MCGRYTYFHDASELGPLFNVEALELNPRYNIAPMQDVSVVRLDKEGEREMVMVRWGLLPFWVKDPEDFKANTINARAENVASSASYREPFKKRRCLILSSGFFEWQQQEGGKQPYFIHLKDGKPFAFAGLWDYWEREGEVIESCSIITTDANALIKDIHSRMPVIAHPEVYDLWLGEEEASPEELVGLLAPYAPEAMEAYPISRRVNNPKAEGEGLLEPIAS